VTRCPRSRRSLALPALTAALLLAAAGASPAWAHGTTIAVAWSGVRPSHVTVVVGAPVHFENANAGSGTCTVVADDGSFESPPLARGEGWHHTFEAPGTWSFHVKEQAGAAGSITVVKR
jgi:plastocyanin